MNVVNIRCIRISEMEQNRNKDKNVTIAEKRSQGVFIWQVFDSSLLFGQMSILSMNIMNDLYVLLHDFIMIYCVNAKRLTQ